MAEIKHAGSRRMFKSDFLESLSRTHISVPLIIFYGTAAVLMTYEFIYNNTLFWWQLLIAFFAGFLGWTLFEYLAHRFIFHVGENASDFRKKIQDTLHGVHHEFPRDKGRLAMPPTISVVIATLVILLFNYIFGTYGFSVVAGFLAGYATYLIVHYSVHAFRPPRNIFRKLWINHSLHHYKNPGQIFGVSSPLWDYVFGTMPKEKY
jgi:sterol desaturase/sphingolipid hydroxylase (fatty acid hydroxylase superfamily)